MRSAEQLQEKPITELYYQEVPYEDDSLGECTECCNEDVLYSLNDRDHVCYDCYHKHYKTEEVG